MDLETIDYRVDDDGVAWLVLNRPDAGNAVDLALARDLMHATIACSGDRGVRAVLLTGAGRNFCVGGDLRSFAAQDPLPNHLKEVTTYLHAAVSRLARMDAPVVAAVQGSAAGAGMSLAIAADIVLVAESARFVLAYTRIGLSPDGSASFSLPRLVGLRMALDLALTNRPVSAAEAVASGLATRAVSDGDLLDEAEQVARQLATGPTAAFGAAKRLLRESIEHSLETQLELETQALCANAASADAREGITAFLEKREPRFSPPT